jgi:hypothetical protein
MTEDEVRALLRTAIGPGRGALKTWAVKHDLIQSNLSEVVRGVRAPPLKVLHALGLRRVVSYELVDVSRSADRPVSLSFPPTTDPAAARDAAGSLLQET